MYVDLGLFVKAEYLELGNLLDSYGLNDEIDHKLSYVSLGQREKAPPRYMQRPEANEEQPVTYHAGSYRAAVDISQPTGSNT
jgi:hypothetical protein